MDLSDSEIYIMNVIRKKSEATSFDVLDETKGKLSENVILDITFID